MALESSNIPVCCNPLNKAKYHAKGRLLVNVTDLIISRAAPYKELSTNMRICQPCKSGLQLRASQQLPAGLRSITPDFLTDEGSLDAPVSTCDVVDTDLSRNIYYFNKFLTAIGQHTICEDKMKESPEYRLARFDELTKIIKTKVFDLPDNV
jgi:hypothetical protein